jgi:cytochrome c oxidase subunit 4
MKSEEMVSRKTLVVVYVALIGPLVLTYVVSLFNLGFAGIMIAVAIAACKAVLIILYFMHVKVSSQLIWIAAAVGFVWLGIMMGLMFNDYLSRNWLAVPGA